MAKKIEKRGIVVCTAKRGVFFGYAAGSAQSLVEKGKLTLERARMCVYWSAQTKGVLGLASHGPAAGSKVGAQVPELAIESVTAVIVCTDAAIKVWEEGSWA